MDPSTEPAVPLLSTPADDAGRQPARDWRPLRLPLYILSILFLAAVALGFIWYDLRQAYRDTLAYWEVQLSTSAAERVGYSNLWLDERQADLEVLAASERSARLLETGGSGDEYARIRRSVEEAIARQVRLKEFVGGALVDMTCRIVAQSGMPAEKLSVRESLGILGMQERALAFGGELVFSSAPSAGMNAKVRIPEGATSDKGGV